MAAECTPHRWLPRYFAQSKPPSPRTDPTVGPCLGSCGGPKGLGVFHERGTPVESSGQRNSTCAVSSSGCNPPRSREGVKIRLRVISGWIDQVMSNVRSGRMCLRVSRILTSSSCIPLSACRGTLRIRKYQPPRTLLGPRHRPTVGS